MPFRNDLAAIFAPRLSGTEEGQGDEPFFLHGTLLIVHPTCDPDRWVEIASDKLRAAITKDPSHRGWDQFILDHEDYHVRQIQDLGPLVLRFWATLFSFFKFLEELRELKVRELRGGQFAIDFLPESDPWGRIYQYTRSEGIDLRKDLEDIDPVCSYPRHAREGKLLHYGYDLFLEGEALFYQLAFSPYPSQIKEKVEKLLDTTCQEPHLTGVLLAQDLFNDPLIKDILIRWGHRLFGERAEKVPSPVALIRELVNGAPFLTSEDLPPPFNDEGLPLVFNPELLGRGPYYGVPKDLPKEMRGLFTVANMVPNQVVIWETDFSALFEGKLSELCSYAPLLIAIKSLSVLQWALFVPAIFPRDTSAQRFKREIIERILERREESYRRWGTLFKRLSVKLGKEADQWLSPLTDTDYDYRVPLLVLSQILERTLSRARGFGVGRLPPPLSPEVQNHLKEIAAILKPLPEMTQFYLNIMMDYPFFSTPVLLGGSGDIGYYHLPPFLVAPKGDLLPSELITYSPWVFYTFIVELRRWLLEGGPLVCPLAELEIPHPGRDREPPTLKDTPSWPRVAVEELRGTGCPFWELVYHVLKACGVQIIIGEEEI